MAKKKTKKDKTKKTHIAAALVPSSSFIAVPRTPPPTDADPEYTSGPLVTGLLSSTMLGRLFTTQDEADDNADVVDTSLEDYANERNLTLERDRERMPTPHDFPDDLEYDQVGLHDYASVRYDADADMYESAEEVGLSRSAPLYALPERKTKKKQQVDEDPVVEDLMIAELAAHKVESGVNVSALDAMEPSISSNRYGMSHSAPAPRTPRNESPRKVDTPRTVEFRRQNDILIKRQEELERRLVEHEQNQMKLFETLEFMADNGEGGQSNTESVEKEKLIDQQATLTDHTLRDQDELIKTLQDRIVNLEVEKQEHEEVNTELQAEIDAFKKYVREREGGQADYTHDNIHAKRQLQDLKDENDTLKKATWRLNQELSRYQAQYRKVDVKNKNVAGLPSKGPIPSWLINTKYLAPLFLLYDDQLREKEDIINQYEEEMETFAHRIEEIAKENERLHIRLEQSDSNGPVSITEWSELQEQAKLVLEENQLLLQQLNIQNGKNKQMNAAHIQETSKLSKRLVHFESENMDLRNTLHEVKGTCATLTAKVQNAAMETELKVALPEHQSAIGEMRKRMEEMNLSHEKESMTLSSKIETIQMENRDLKLKLSDLESEKDKTDLEHGNMKRTYKKLQKKYFIMKKVLEEWHDEESSAKHYLSSVVKAAEQTAVERDTYAQLIREQEHERKRSLKEMVEGTVMIERMDERLKSYKNNATRRLADVIEKMKDQEQSYERKKMEYELEIRQLKALISDKEGLVDIVRHEKKLVEGELENMWKKTGKDDQRMRESLERTFQKLRQHKRMETRNQDEDIKELLGYPSLESEYLYDQ